EDVDPGEVDVQVYRDRQWRDLTVEVPRNWTETSSTFQRDRAYRRDSFDADRRGGLDRDGVFDGDHRVLDRGNRVDNKRSAYYRGGTTIQTPRTDVNVVPRAGDVNVQTPGTRIDVDGNRGGLIRGGLLPRRN